MRSPLSTPQHIYSIIIDPTSTQYTLYKPILKHLYEVIYPEDEYTLESYCSKIFIVAYTDTKSSIMGYIEIEEKKDLLFPISFPEHTATILDQYHRFTRAFTA